MKTLSAALFLLAFTAGCADGPAADADGANASGGESPAYYVQAGRSEDGDGSRTSPFASLSGAAAAAEPGATIFLLGTGTDVTLDGGIALRPGQKLIGLAADGTNTTDPDTMPRLTNTTDHLGGSVVQLSERNEIRGIRLGDLQSHGIVASAANLSGTKIHHVAVSGAAESEEIIWSIRLEVGSGVVSDVSITDCSFRDGHDLGGIQIVHSGDSAGDYVFARNDFSDLGGRGYHLQSRDTSRIDARILDSTADNIGRGGRNSDSILPHLQNSSEQNILVQNYRFKNTEQEGNQSNCGLEAFIEGAPFPSTDNYCDGCKLTLEIVDSVFEQPVTDGIQLINFGSNTVLDVRIRGTRIIGADPQQVGGGLSLLAQNADNTGSRTTLLVENTDIVGSSGVGFALSDQGEGYTATVDLGGGELGSVGNNRIVGSANGEVQIINGHVVAKNNWWGGSDPRVELQGNASWLDSDPAIESDPRSR